MRTNPERNTACGKPAPRKEADREGDNSEGQKGSSTHLRRRAAGRGAARHRRRAVGGRGQVHAAAAAVVVVGDGETGGRKDCDAAQPYGKARSACKKEDTDITPHAAEASQLSFDLHLYV